MYRFLTFKRLVAIALSSLLAVAVGVFGYQVTRVQISRSIRDKVDRLVLYPPKSIPKLEWAILVKHTSALHLSSAPQLNMSFAELQTLSRDLDEMLSSSPNRDSIDYLWDQYSQMTEGGARHREIYEPDLNARLVAAARDGDAYKFRQSYMEFASGVASENQR